MAARIAEIVALAIIVGCVVRGKNRGLLMQVYSLVRIVLIIVLTAVLKSLILPRVPEYLPNEKGIAYTIAIIVSIIAVAFIDHLLKSITKIPMDDNANTVGGALIGIAIGLIVDWLLVQFFIAFKDATWAKQAAMAVQNSPVLTYLIQFNIF